MANTLTPIMHKILARGLMALRQRVIMPSLVNTDWSLEFAKKGDTVNVPLSAPATVSDVTPAAVPPTPTSYAPASFALAVDQWKKTDFHLKDDELVKIDKDEHFMPLQTWEAFKALANNINQYVWSKYKLVYGYAGTAGTVPFSSDLTAATDARKVLAMQLCPPGQRYGILNYNAEASALTQAAFRDASQSGKSEVVIEGRIGRFFGIDWMADDHVPTHASTALSAGAATVNGVNAVNAGSTDNGRTGTISITKATNTSPLVVGDILSIAGQTTTFAVRTNVTLAVGNTTVDIAPALPIATAGGEAVTLKATHVVNMVFQRDAFCYATRPLLQTSVDLATGRNLATLSDPVSGLVFRLEVLSEYKQTAWELDVLYGADLVRPEFACRVAG
ncbi:P22 coat protein [Caudoviricetes sp.]|nr:P22 coat protein [Caudoviricetes sp.]UOF82743.1 P22 coat protein [Caudoviricetes sp.]